MDNDKFDYRSMLERYISGILAYEGTSFMEHIGSDFTKEENEEIKKMIEGHYASCRLHSQSQ